MKKQERVLAVAACATVASIAVAAVLVVSAFGSAARPSQQDRVFSALNARNVDNAQAQINGSANAHNQIPVGTVLTYKTSTGNLGKLQILKYGYNLRIRWVTYRPNGTVLSSGKNLPIRGTYAYDLDQGKATGPTSPPADFWWEQTTSKLRYLAAQNGASFTIASYQRCELARPGPGQSECLKKP